MIISRFINNKVAQLGIIEGDRIIPLGAIDLMDYLYADKDIPRGQALELNEVKLLCPFEEAGRVFCLGKNYLDHIQELSEIEEAQQPQAPIYFMKAPKILISDGDGLKDWQDHTESLDYEVELVLVIGKQCKNLKKEEVESVIFGYMIGNDFTARDLQTSHKQWLKGKSLDGFTALSTRLITRESIAYPPQLDLSLTVNGEERQRGNTRDLIFDIDQLVSQLSQGLTLYPGDIIFTGTPSGVGAGRKPPEYLKKGDIVQCKIEGLGSLTNIIK